MEERWGASSRCSPGTCSRWAARCTSSTTCGGARTASPTQLYWAGNLALVVQVAVITLVLTRHRLAPLAAAAAGFPLALGFFAAHWLPEWSALSDPVWEIGGWFSYLASTLEIVGALAIGLAGSAIVRARGLAAFGRPTPPIASGAG